jgi:hypothetical protein
VTIAPKVILPSGVLRTADVKREDTATVLEQFDLVV